MASRSITTLGTPARAIVRHDHARDAAARDRRRVPLQTAAKDAEEQNTQHDEGHHDIEPVALQGNATTENATRATGGQEHQETQLNEVPAAPVGARTQHAADRAQVGGLTAKQAIVRLLRLPWRNR
jgi:hypothetical protein